MITILLLNKQWKPFAAALEKRIKDSKSRKTLADILKTAKKELAADLIFHSMAEYFPAKPKESSRSTRTEA